MQTKPFKSGGVLVPVDVLDTVASWPEFRYDDLYKALTVAGTGETVSWRQRAASAYLRRHLASGLLQPVEPGSTTYRRTVK